MVVIMFVAYLSFFYLSSVGYVPNEILFFFGHVDLNQLFNSGSFLVPLVYFFYVVTMTMVLKKLGVALIVTMTKVVSDQCDKE